MPDFTEMRKEDKSKSSDSNGNNSNSSIQSPYYVQANLENWDFRGQNLDGANFHMANLRMAILEDVSCEPVKVHKIGPGCLSIFIGIFFEIISGGRSGGGWSVEPLFVDAMKPADFSGANLTGANFKRAKLREANFREAILINTNLSDAILLNADMREANLSGANLSYADIRDALFYKTNLEGANLTGAKLDGTDFESANLENTIFHNADLRNAKYLDRAIGYGIITSDRGITNLATNKFAVPIQNELPGAKEPIIKKTSSGYIPGGSADRQPIIIGAILGLIAAILSAYVSPLLMFGFESSGYHSVAEYLTQTGNFLCVPVIASWSVAFGILGSLFGQRVGLKMKRPTATTILMIIGGIIGSGLGFLLGLPLMFIVVGLGS
jgi:uncharacterized protein YjbI with pentapeptide repeats